MNDLMYLYLEYDPENVREQEKVDALLPRIDELLKKHGWEYSGICNMYRPIKGTDCDETCFQAMQAVKNAEWLKEYKPYFQIGMWTNACSLDDIVITDVQTVPPEKMKRYEDDYATRHTFAHAIVVDENHVLRDGYITYLLAKANDGKPDILSVRSDQIFKKVVRGEYIEGAQTVKNEEKGGTWYYDIPEAVIPGDILMVKTQTGSRPIRVRQISYVAGSHDCGIYSRVLAHMG